MEMFENKNSQMFQLEESKNLKKTEDLLTSQKIETANLFKNSRML